MNTVTYTLPSGTLINTPGLVRAARATYHTETEYWRNVFMTGYDCPPEVTELLIGSKLPYTYDDEGLVTFIIPRLVVSVTDAPDKYAVFIDGEEEAGGYGYGPNPSDATRDFIENHLDDHLTRLGL